VAKPHKKCTDEELLDMLARRVAIQGELLDNLNPRKANAQVAIIVKLSCELLRRGSPVHPKILSLLENENPHVRFWAAFLALEIDPPRGERVLEEISRMFPRNLNLGFSAGYTLEQWRKRELRTLSQWGCGTDGPESPRRNQSTPD
jgi:hypothetical protein